MSYCPTAPTALEHDTARRLDPIESPRPIQHAHDLMGRCDDVLVDSAPVPVPTAPYDPARQALERTCLTVKRIALDIGMPRATLEAYRLGTRRMPKVARVRLGTYLAAHAAMLDGLAQALMAAEVVVDA